jgi:hypothetical protein
MSSTALPLPLTLTRRAALTVRRLVLVGGNLELAGSSFCVEVRWPDITVQTLRSSMPGTGKRIEAPPIAPEGALHVPVARTNRLGRRD